jgi:hypothetical protein
MSRTPRLYPTCRVILCFDDHGNNVLCGKKTLDGSPYCPEHENQSDVVTPFDDDDDFTTVTEELED